MFRVGIVSAQDPSNCRVRVSFPDHDQLQSWWLPIVVPKTQNDKAYWVPDLGEQVVCMMDEHDEDGAVLGSIYSSVDKAPVQSVNKWHLKFSDGGILEYDRSLHLLSVSLPVGGTITISANGATMQIDASGNIQLTAASDKQIQLGPSASSGVARLGDTVHVLDDEGAILSGTIVTASTNVFAG